MKLVAVMVTHNRLEYTQETWDPLWRWSQPQDGPHIVVDNASTDGTRDWLKVAVARSTTILNDRNLFPGAACNIGWHRAMSNARPPDLLMRLDNDVKLIRGWRKEVEDAFTAHPTLGQLGVLNLHEDYDGNQPVTEWTENGHTLNVASPWTGGNCVIRRELWDQGLRWDSNPWRPGANEDTLMSQAIHDLGWKVARVIPTIANNQSYHQFAAYPAYYTETARLRGLVPELSV